MGKPTCSNCQHYEAYFDQIKVCRNADAIAEISGDSRLFIPSPYFDDCNHHKAKEKELA